MTRYARIVALDLSLTSTGMAWGVTAAGWPQVTRVESKPPRRVTLASRSHRLRTIAGEVTQRCAGADLVLVEAPTYSGKTTGSAHDRAGLWWLVVGRLTGAGLNVVEVELHAVKMYATGRGNADKDAVLAAVVRRYPHVEVTGNDEADALVLYAMGARFCGSPIDGDLPKTHLRGMDRVAWTPTTRK